MRLDYLQAQLALEEGSRLAAYLDTEGILTVGIGHNCRARPVAGVNKPGARITRELEAELFAADIEDVLRELDNRWPWWTEMDDVRQNVLANMCFNMGGTTLSGFRNTLRAMEAGDYLDASERMLQSKWARQVGKRAVRLSAMMATGAWPDDVPGIS